MQSILNLQCPIHFNSKGYDELNTLISNSKYSKIFILVDKNTHKYCLPHFLNMLGRTFQYDLIEIEPGEENKSIATCSKVWHMMSELGGDRKTVLINLGGGVITDLGGFVASTFKRGIKFINIPTSILGMVDAAIGGKTGVDLGVLKNQVGVVNLGEMVLIDTLFLKTLEMSQMRSGIAEMLKHGLITDEAYWNKMAQIKLGEFDNLDALIYESVIIKNEIVTEDPNETGLRKTLNFGHTLGHAIESYFLKHPKKKHLLHGEAVAIGMILAIYLSSKLVDFPSFKMEKIKSIITTIFGKENFETLDYQPIIDLLKFDKKNTYGTVNFVLLKDIGQPLLDCVVDNQLIIDAFKYYTE